SWRAKSTSSRSRAPSASRTSRSLDGGVRLLVARPARFLDPVAAGPADALPGLEGRGLDLEQPARLLHGRLQVGGTVLAQVAVAHPRRDRHPLAADVGPLHEAGLTFAEHLAERLRLLDDNRNAWVGDQVVGP